MKNYQRVILIDDDEITNYINENLIRDVGLGTEVLTYTEAETALEFIRREQGPPKTLLLLDLKMPVFDGFDFLEKYGELQASVTQAYRLVVLTTSENPKDLQKIKEYGCEEHIAKPLTRQKLMEIG